MTDKSPSPREQVLQQQQRRVSQMSPKLAVREAATTLEHQPPETAELPVTDLASGLRVLVDKSFLLRPKYADQQKRAVREGAHPKLLEFERLFVRRLAKKYGIPMFAHCVVRTAEEQKRLYVQGFSKASGGLSPHQYGCAVDIIHSLKAWKLERESWTMVGHIGKELALQMGVKLVWGGDWSFYDPAHWELSDWRSIAGGFPFSGG